MPGSKHTDIEKKRTWLAGAKTRARVRDRDFQTFITIPLKTS